MKENLMKAGRWMRRYITFTLLAIVAYVVFLLFFNENSYARNAELEDEIARLKAEIKQNTDTLNHYLIINRNLATDREALERIVREQYHMQQPHEDVYVVAD